MGSDTHVCARQREPPNTPPWMRGGIGPQRAHSEDTLNFARKPLRAKAVRQDAPCGTWRGDRRFFRSLAYTGNSPRQTCDCSYYKNPKPWVIIQNWTAEVLRTDAFYSRSLKNQCFFEPKS